MKAWYDNHEPWEKLVILTLAGLIVFVILVFGILTPVTSAKQAAIRAQTAAQTDLALVQRGLNAFTSGANTQAKSSFTREALFQTARQANINISRIQAAEAANGQASSQRVWFENATTVQLFAFLAQLSDRYHVQITRAQINANADQTVSAQFTLSPTTSYPAQP